ncbi:MAG TPA: pirin family protein, partial [Verrucomicrobiae bacterium]|nr:pirin family protein [Verrucomicrobiae bacterium]
PAGQLTLVASKSGRDGSVTINQDAELHLAKFNGGETVTHTLGSGRHAWVQVAEGSVTLNGQKLAEGDGAAVSNETALALSSSGKAQVLVFDLA